MNPQEVQVVVNSPCHIVVTVKSQEWSWTDSNSLKTKYFTVGDVHVVLKKKDCCFSVQCVVMFPEGHQTSVTVETGRSWQFTPFTTKTRLLHSAKLTPIEQQTFCAPVGRRNLPVDYREWHVSKKWTIFVTDTERRPRSDGKIIPKCEKCKTLVLPSGQCM